MGLGVNVLQIRSFSAHRRPEVYDFTVDFLGVVVNEAHWSELLTTCILEDFIDFFVCNIGKEG